MGSAKPQQSTRLATLLIWRVNEHHAADQNRDQTGVKGTSAKWRL
jgi:hypothetical protein